MRYEEFCQRVLDAVPFASATRTEDNPYQRPPVVLTKGWEYWYNNIYKDVLNRGVRHAVFHMLGGHSTNDRYAWNAWMVGARKNDERARYFYLPMLKEMMDQNPELRVISYLGSLLADQFTRWAGRGPSSWLQEFSHGFYQEMQVPRVDLALDNATHYKPGTIEYLAVELLDRLMTEDGRKVYFESLADLANPQYLSKNLCLREVYWRFQTHLGQEYRYYRGPYRGTVIRWLTDGEIKRWWAGNVEYAIADILNDGHSACLYLRSLLRDTYTDMAGLYKAVLPRLNPVGFDAT